MLRFSWLVCTFAVDAASLAGGQSSLPGGLLDQRAGPPAPSGVRAAPCGALRRPDGGCLSTLWALWDSGPAAARVSPPRRATPPRPPAPPPMRRPLPRHATPRRANGRPPAPFPPPPPPLPLPSLCRPRAAADAAACYARCRRSTLAINTLARRQRRQLHAAPHAATHARPLDTHLEFHRAFFGGVFFFPFGE